MTYERGEIVAGSATDRALRALSDYPAGVHSRTLAVVIDCSEQRSCAALRTLAKMGRVVGVADPMQRASIRLRWCLTENVEACRDAVERERMSRKGPTPWAKAGLGRVPSQHLARAPSVAPIVPKHVKVTRVPSMVDARYTVAHPEPYFSRPGYTPDSMHTGSAIERAYSDGGRR